MVANIPFFQALLEWVGQMIFVGPSLQLWWLSGRPGVDFRWTFGEISLEMCWTFGGLLFDLW